MAVSKDLFELILRMTPSEKKFFRNDTFKGKKDSYYLKMFDYIDKQEYYDEDLLLKKMKKTKGFSKLSTSKNYLYKLIIESLSKVFEEDNINFILRKKMDEIEILMKKNLYQKSLSKINKAIKLCKKHEILDYELFFQRYAISLNVRIAKINEFDYSECEKTENRLNNQMEYIYTKYKIKSYINQLGQSTDNNVEKKTFNDLVSYIENEPLYSDEKNAITSTSKLTYFTFNAMLFALKKEYSKAYEFGKKSVELIKRDIDKFTFIPNRIISVYGNFISLSLSEKKYDTFLLSISDLKHFSENYNTFNNNEIKARIFECVSCHEIMYYIETLQLEKCKNAIGIYEKQFKELNDFLNNANRYDFYSEVATFYFYTNKNLKSLEYIQDLLYSENEQINEMSLLSAYMLSIILYFEEEMHSLMKSNMRSLKRLLTKYQRFGKEDLLLFKFLNQLLKTPKGEQQDLFKKVLTDISEMEKKGSSFDIYTFDIVFWIKSKAFNKNILYYLEEENKLLKKNI